METTHRFSDSRDCEIIKLPLLLLLSTFLRNFILRQGPLSSDVPPHLAQPCYVALGQALIWGLYPDWLRALSTGFPLPRLGPAIVSSIYRVL